MKTVGEIRKFLEIFDDDVEVVIKRSASFEKNFTFSYQSVLVGNVGENQRYFSNFHPNPEGFTNKNVIVIE